MRISFFSMELWIPGSAARPRNDGDGVVLETLKPIPSDAPLLSTLNCHKANFAVHRAIYQPPELAIGVSVATCSGDADKTPVALAAGA